MKRHKLVSVSVICGLLISAVGHAESRVQILRGTDRFQQSTNLADAIRTGAPTFYFVQATANEKKNNDQARNFEFNHSVVQKINKAVLSMESACESVKIPAEKIAAAGKGLYELLNVATKYEPMDARLRISTRILLAELRDILILSFVMKHDVPFDEWVKIDNVYYNFVSYYKFMHNLGDKIRPEDFRQDWARNIARGLACLYE